MVHVALRKFLGAKNLISIILQLTLLALTFMLTTAARAQSLAYEHVKEGTLQGTLFVMWVAEDKFVFAPDPRNPLTFTRRDGAKIKPSIMYTDGGSIPKLIQPLDGFSPWGYAPAYMIHDWIFTARHCIVDGMDDPRYDDVRSVQFDESALILAEVMKTLIVTKQVPKNEFAFGAIGNAVDSVIARSLWNKTGVCKQNIVDPRHIEAIRAAFGQGRSRPNVPKALRVAQFSFSPR